MIFVLSGVLALTFFLAIDRVVIWLRTRQPDILTERAHAKVILTLANGESFRGVLWQQDRSGIVLRNADGLGMGERGTDLAVDGEVFVPQEGISYLQIL